MPSKDTTRLVHTPTSREHLAAIEAHGRANGTSFLYRDGCGSESAIARYGWAIAAEHIAAGATPKAVPTDGERLKAARDAAGLTMAQLAALLGYADSASIRNVERKGMALHGRLRAWVDGHVAK